MALTNEHLISFDFFSSYLCISQMQAVSIREKYMNAAEHRTREVRIAIRVTGARPCCSICNLNQLFAFYDIMHLI
jgi:hypothetical protein